jgi:hypothetical protein
MSSTRRVRSQLDLINQFVGFWDSDENSPDYGTVTGENLGRIMSDESINMDHLVKAAGTWDRALINQKLGLSPVLIGYLELEVNGFHVNIIHSLNDTPTADVNVMDPNRGRFRTRSNNHFTRATYVLGWAK